MANRVLIVATETVAERPPGLPEAVRRQVMEAAEVRVVAPLLATRLQSWTSAIDAPAQQADARQRAIVANIETAGQYEISGTIGDEDPVQAIADALVSFQADALILARHTPQVENPSERRLLERTRDRFDLPITELLIDGEGRVVSSAA